MKVWRSLSCGVVSSLRWCPVHLKMINMWSKNDRYDRHDTIERIFIRVVKKKWEDVWDRSCLMREKICIWEESICRSKISMQIGRRDHDSQRQYFYLIRRWSRLMSKWTTVFYTDNRSKICRVLQNALWCHSRTRQFCLNHDRPEKNEDSDRARKTHITHQIKTVDTSLLESSLNIWWD